MALSEEMRRMLEFARAARRGTPSKRVYLARERRGQPVYHARGISYRPGDEDLFIAPDAEALRRRVANSASPEPLHYSDVDVAEYYGPYLPFTEAQLYPDGSNAIFLKGLRNGGVAKYVPQDYFDARGSYAFDERDYWLLKQMRDEAEAKRRTREEYLDGDWYQD